MKGHPEVIDVLNRALTADLTAVDMYFLQSKVCEDRGYVKLQAHFLHERDEEQVHVTMLIDRILLLEGQPNLSDRLPFETHDDIKKLIEMNLDMELDVSRLLNDGIALARDKRDNASRELMERLLAETENDHILWLESQLRIIGDIGQKKYLAEQM